MSSMDSQVLHHLMAAGVNVTWRSLAWGALYLVFFVIYGHESKQERYDWSHGPTLRRDFLTLFSPLYFLPAFLAQTIAAAAMVVPVGRVHFVNWQDGYSTNLAAEVRLGEAPAIPLAVIALAPLLFNLPTAVLLCEYPGFVPSEAARGALAASLLLSPLSTWRESWTRLKATARPLGLFALGGCFCYAAVVTLRVAQGL